MQHCSAAMLSNACEKFGQTARLASTFVIVFEGAVISQLTAALRMQWALLSLATDSKGQGVAGVLYARFDRLIPVKALCKNIDTLNRAAPKSQPRPLPTMRVHYIASCKQPNHGFFRAFMQLARICRAQPASKLVLFGDMDDAFGEDRDARAISLAYAFAKGALLPPESLVPARMGNSDTGAVQRLLQELVCAMLHWSRRC